MSIVASGLPRSRSSLDTIPKFYLVELPKKVAFENVDGSADIDPGDDNPFRPGSELSREADFIVNLIKEGKPITPTGELMINANHTESSQQSPINHEQVAKLKNRQQTQSKLTQKSDENVDISEKSPSDRSKISVEPGQHIDIQHGVVVSPKHGGQTIEKVTIRKRKKCCSIQ